MNPAEAYRPAALAMDNLNTHKLESLYEAYPPEWPRRFAERRKIHDTPNHGSRLNVANIELRVLPRQVLDQRIETAGALRREVTASKEPRNDRTASATGDTQEKRAVSAADARACPWPS
jgi:hypothetical protein